MAKEHDVAAAADIDVSQMVPVRIGRSTIIVTRLPCGSVRAISARCPHMGADLQFGAITGLAQGDERDAIEMTREGEVLRCPWHGFEFDLKTGEPVVQAPEGCALQLRIYEAQERDGRVFVST